MTLPHHALRQSAASLFAYALLELFPDAQLMESDLDQIGFSYKFFLNQPLEEGVLTLFEEKMRALAKKALSVEALDMMRENAADLFRHRKQVQKASLVAAAPENIVSIVKIGDSFYDYGQPPYVRETGELAAFKLQKLEKVKGEEHVFRVEGTVFPDAKALKGFLKAYEEAKRKDHRLLGRELALYTHIEEGGKGEWFWLPKGAFLKEVLLQWCRREHQVRQFHAVATPSSLDDFQVKRRGGGRIDEDAQSEGEGSLSFLLPRAVQHALVFGAQQHSYRDLPVRYYEVAEQRRRPSVKTSGLFLSRAFTVDSAHIFCSHEQVSEELISSLQFIEKTVNILGFECRWNLLSRASKFAGTKERWDKATGLMVNALQQCNCAFDIDKAGGSLSGPRVVVRMKDALGREWDGPYVGIDLSTPENFGLHYQGAGGEVRTPCMITRSVFGSLERCIAVLVEQCGGDLPLWLLLEQVRLLPIGVAHQAYAEEVCRLLVVAGVRCRVDSRQEPLGGKVHAAEREKVPYVVIVGDEEKREGAVNVRSSSGKGRTRRMELARFLQMLQEEAAAPDARDGHQNKETQRSKETG